MAGCLLRIIGLGFILSCAFPELAHAYVDPGSGGYLINYLVVAIGGAFAFASAFIIHLFRSTIGRWTSFLWQKHRVLFIAGILLAAGAVIFAAMIFLVEPRIPRFDPKISGVQIYDPEKTYDGYNLFNGYLIDMRGRVMKKWTNKELGVLDSNGDYYAQKSYESPLWGRYTWDDKVVWEKKFPIHHEILLTPKGTIITFTKAVHMYNGRKVEFDVILEYDKDGNELQRFDLWDRFKGFHNYHLKMELDEPASFRQPKENLKKDSAFGGDYDYYHLNALSIVPKNSRMGVHPAFNPGNWLVCFRHGSMLFILDKDTKRLLWRAIDKQVAGNIEGPHSPSMLANGNILFFDNGRYRKWSRIVEIDPITLKVVWEYRANGFYTLTQGFVQPLPNGNMLVTETEKGRVFEITPDKEIVWEYYNPVKLDKDNSKEKKRWGFRQEIYRTHRYSKDMIDAIIKPKEQDVIPGPGKP